MSLVSLYSKVQGYLKSEKGQGMIEYALIIAFVVAIAVYLTNSGSLGSAIESTFDSAKSQLEK